MDLPLPTSRRPSISYPPLPPSPPPATLYYTTLHDSTLIGLGRRGQAEALLVPVGRFLSLTSCTLPSGRQSRSGLDNYDPFLRTPVRPPRPYVR